MSTFKTKSASDADFELLFGLHRLVFEPHIARLWGWDEVWQRDRLRRDLEQRATLLMFDGDSLVGYVQTAKEVDALRLCNIAIAPGFQKRGIGTRILTELKEEAALNGVPVQLSVFATNSDAFRFYKRLGFREVSRDGKFIDMVWGAKAA